MDHRDKRPRLDDEVGAIFNPEVSTCSTEPVSAATNTVENPVATDSAAAEDGSNTTQDTSVPPTSQVNDTPDKSTWQGWAEIENDPV
jgi:hypothetical protein